MPNVKLPLGKLGIKRIREAFAQGHLLSERGTLRRLRLQTHCAQGRPEGEHENSPGQSAAEAWVEIRNRGEAPSGRPIFCIRVFGLYALEMRRT
jgi:hypothetical protein